MGDGRWDVVDLGSKGGAAVGLFLRRRLARFGGGLADVTPLKCLCIDRNPEHRAAVEKRGYVFYCADVMDVGELPPADYYVMWNFLEHLPSVVASQAVLLRALDAASLGVSLLLPSFENDAQLERAGLQFVWTRWTGHPSHFKVCDALEVIDSARGWGVSEATVEAQGSVASSESESLMPRFGESDAGGWDRQRYERGMGPKALVAFDPPVTTRWGVDIHVLGRGPK